MNLTEQINLERGKAETITLDADDQSDGLAKSGVFSLVFPGQNYH